MIGDTSHKYVGSDSRGDVYQVFDGTNVIEWAVKYGDDSRNVIAGTVVNLGPPSSMTVAQASDLAAKTGTDTAVAPASNTVTNSAPVVPAPSITANTAVAAVVGDRSHKYVGTDARGDVYQLFDGTNVIEWAVKPGDDSRNAIAGTMVNLGPPSKMTVAQAPAASVVNNTPAASTASPGAASSVPNPTGGKVGVSVPSNSQLGTSPAVSNGSVPGVPGSTIVNNPSTAPVGDTPPQKTDPRHKYVGRDQRGDVWQIFDGTNVLEWAVKPGDPSGAVIAGTLTNLGPPSNYTVAQNDGTLPGSPGSTVPGTGANLTASQTAAGSSAPLTSGGSSSFAGLAIAALGVLVQAIK